MFFLYFSKYIWNNMGINYIIMYLIQLNIKLFKAKGFVFTKLYKIQFNLKFTIII